MPFKKDSSQSLQQDPVSTQRARQFVNVLKYDFHGCLAIGGNYAIRRIATSPPPVLRWYTTMEMATCSHD